MANSSTIHGAIFETVKEEGKKVVKEVATEIVKTPLNILEGVTPLPPQEYQAKKMQEEQKKAKGFASIRSELSQQIQTAPKQKEDRRLFQGAAIAERGQINANAQMNNAGGQSLSANMKPQKKMEPLEVQQKRNNKLHGAG